MKNSPKNYGLFAVFSFILAAHWYFFDFIAVTIGKQIVIGANNMSTASGADEVFRNQADFIMTKFHEYLIKFYPLQYQWTIGSSHYIPMYLAVFFTILGAVFLLLALRSRD